MILQGAQPLEYRNISPFRTPIFNNVAPQLDIVLEKIEEEKEKIKLMIESSIEQSLEGNTAKKSMQMGYSKLQ
jgi:hypothetical protein